MVVKNKSREETMQKLLQAGLKVFAEHGFDGATTKMVSIEAGINESLINRYFDGKKGLLRAIIIEFIRNLEASSDYPEQKTIAAEIQAFMQACLVPCSENLAFIRLVISQALVDEELSREINSKHQHPTEELLLKRLKVYQKKGLISKSRDLQSTVDLLHYFISGVMFKNAVGSTGEASAIDSMIKKISKQMALDLTKL